LVAACLIGAARADEASPLSLSYIDTPDVELVYFDPTLSYLTPHAIRTFTNAIAWQKRVMGWQPYERTTLLLKDFSDYGNANASPLPRNTLRFDIAPVSYAFETYSAAERLYSIMNHELTHVATTDIWNEEDAQWRRLFFGKVYPKWQHPESLLYSYLTVPRFTVPRWYAEGSAVFMETWMAGGWDASRAASTRWCSARWCATTRRSTIRWAWNRAALASTSRAAPTRTSTARGSSRTAHTPTGPRR
jgi:hypothetical protein